MTRDYQIKKGTLSSFQCLVGNHVLTAFVGVFLFVFRLQNWRRMSNDNKRGKLESGCTDR